MGLITTVEAVHLEAFGSIEGIAKEKASLVEGLLPGGVMVLNRDTASYPVLRSVAAGAGATTVSFGASRSAVYR